MKQVRTVEGPEALGHDLAYVEAKQPTATEDVNIAYYVCSRCNKYFEDSEAAREITDRSNVIILAPDTVPETGYEDAMRQLGIIMIVTSFAASAIYLKEVRQRKQDNQQKVKPKRSGFDL